MMQNIQCLICHEDISGIEPREMISCKCKFIACDDCFRQLNKCVYCHKYINIYNPDDDNELTEEGMDYQYPVLNSVLQRSFHNDEYINAIEYSLDTYFSYRFQNRLDDLLCDISDHYYIPKLIVFKNISFLVSIVSAGVGIYQYLNS